jgi:hypothetical protein
MTSAFVPDDPPAPGGSTTSATAAPAEPHDPTRDPKKLRTLSEFTHALRPTSARYSHATTPAAKAPAATPAAASTFVTRVANAARAGNMGDVAAEALNFVSESMQAPASASIPEPTSRDRFAPTVVNPSVPLEPSDRVMELQRFLTHLYSEIAGADYRPAQDVSWFTNEILVNDQYYGTMIAAHQRLKLFAGKDKNRIPSIEDIARNPDSVLYEGLVALTVAKGSRSHQRSRDRDKAKFGFTSLSAQSSRDDFYGDEIGQACVDVFLGKVKRTGISFLNPKV